MLDTDEISNSKEKEKLEYAVKTKKWNPYCIRHSAITSDSDYLPEYALKKKVRWSMNSKQGSRYIKRRMGNELKFKILEHSGIIIEPLKNQKESVRTCPRCELVNTLENKYCSKCSYPLTPEAYDQIKQSEENRIKDLESKYNQEMINFKQEIDHKLQLIFKNVDFAKIKQ